MLTYLKPRCPKIGHLPFISRNLRPEAQALSTGVEHTGVGWGGETLVQLDSTGQLGVLLGHVLELFLDCWLNRESSWSHIVPLSLVESNLLCRCKH